MIIEYFSLDDGILWYALRYSLRDRCRIQQRGISLFVGFWESIDYFKRNVTQRNFNTTYILWKLQNMFTSYKLLWESSGICENSCWSEATLACGWVKYTVYREIFWSGTVRNFTLYPTSTTILMFRSLTQTVYSFAETVEHSPGRHGWWWKKFFACHQSPQVHNTVYSLRPYNHQ